MDSSLCDSKGSVWLEEKIVAGLNKLDNSLLLGSSKVWVLQFLLLFQVRWTIMIYDIPISTVEKLEQRISKYIRKWLGFHPSISSLALYSKSSPCPLPFTSLTSLFKTTKASAHLQLRDSKDPVISSSVPVLETGKKWSVSESVQDAESILHFKKILGHTQTGKAGLGYTPIEQIPAKGSKEYRKAVSDTISNIHDQVQLSSQDGKRLQLNWTTWSNYVRNDLSWKCIWAFGPQLLRFCVQSSFNTLPSPNNCVRWKFTNDQSCILCKASLCTLPHILSGCPFSLKNGRWNYRHDCVLKVLLDGLEELVKEKRSKPVPSKSSLIKFVKPGQGSQSKSRKSFGLLDKARDWVILADIGDCNLIFPSEIFSTSERPDIVIFSISTKTVILIENTSGCEENNSENHSFKTNKYRDLIDAIRANGWVCHLFAIEVGARGFNSTHVPFCLKSLGFLPKSVKSLLRRMSQAALKASYQIWLARNDKEWKAPVVQWKTSFGPRIPRPVSAPCTTTKEPVAEVKEAESIDFVISPASPKLNARPSDKDAAKCSISMPSATPDAKRIEKQVSKQPLTPSQTSCLPIVKPSARTSFRRPWLGLVNEGNTCYANSVLNCLFPFPELWDFSSRVPLHQAAKAMLVAMNVRPKDPAKATPLRPRIFLKALTEHMTRSQSRPFRHNQQHDASEILGYVLNELISAGVDRKLVCYSFATSYRCQVCNTTRKAFLGEVGETILNLGARDSISSALLERLSGGVITRDCNSCGSDQKCIEQLSFSELPDVLILRLRRDQFDEGRGEHRVGRTVLCDRELVIGCGQRDEVCSETYQLIAVIHHIGRSSSSGHYFTSLIDPRTKRMWKHDDSSVSEVRTLDQRSAYLLFYRKVKR